jgi:hypothetical protein
MHYILLHNPAAFVHDFIDRWTSFYSFTEEGWVRSDPEESEFHSRRGERFSFTKVQ